MNTHVQPKPLLEKIRCNRTKGCNGRIIGEAKPVPGNVVIVKCPSCKQFTTYTA